MKQYDVICIEDLNVKGMIKNPKLSKAIQDISWGKLISFLEYKCNYNDKSLIKINRFFPSSKTCYSCGTINSSLQLNDREWVCGRCGEIHDRDINAAKNILKQGLTIITSSGSGDYTRGAQISLKVEKQRAQALKREA